MNEQKKVHIIAVCGTAMSSFAGMLKERGYLVSGSDQNMYPPMSDQLKTMNIEVFEGYRPENIKDPDLVIIGNTIKKDNPEAQTVIERGIPYYSFPEAISEFFLKEKKPLVVAGTHGKTTTTSLSAWVFDRCGVDPSFMIGGIPRNYGLSFHLGKGEVFIIEGDEYTTSFFDRRPKFLHYRPSNLIITGIEFDHADVFDSLETIVGEFTNLIRLLPSDGIVSVCADNKNALDVVKHACCGIETYGLHNPDARWTARKIDYNGDGMSFTIYCNDLEIGHFRSALIGEHNLYNTLGVVSMAIRLGLDKDRIAEALTSFKGVKRRMEVFAEASGVTIIDDFAHHPTAIRETIKAVKHKYPNRRLWTVFEPRTNSTRRNIFQKELGESLLEGENVIIAPVFKAEMIADQERFIPELAIERLHQGKVNAFHYKQFDQIMAKLGADLRTGDVVLILSNGGFEGIHGKLAAVLNNRKAAV